MFQDPSNLMAALGGSDGDTVGQLVRLGEERDLPRVTWGVSVFEPRPFLLYCGAFKKKAQSGLLTSSHQTGGAWAPIE